MSETNIGGPAFPVTEQNGANFGDCGMTLRDYFAAAALTGYRTFCGQWYAKHGAEFASPKKMAEWAYADADAMLKAREA